MQSADFRTALDAMVTRSLRRSRASVALGKCSKPTLRVIRCPMRRAHVWFTDPPYYDAIPYADLSDFFFVWLKRALPEHRAPTRSV